jgi:hypothetical protein
MVALIDAYCKLNAKATQLGREEALSPTYSPNQRTRLELWVGEIINSLA